MRTAQNIIAFLAAFAAASLAPATAQAQRIRDVARVKGVRPQHLTGIGLVIGLAGSGDSQQSELKKKFFANLIRNMGANFPLSANDLRSRNTALVIVSATVPSTLKVGAEFDVTVSSLGDASTLRGGHLLAVPLRGPSAVEPELGKNMVPYYALAQGDVFVEKEGDGKATVGRSHAVLEAAIDDATFPANLDSITVLLLEPDFGTAARIAARINRQELFREPDGPARGDPLAAAVDSGTVRVRIPNHFLREDRVVDFISRVLDLEVPEVEGEALISINRQSGAVVINGAVRVSASAVVTYKGAMVRIPDGQRQAAAGAPPGAPARPAPVELEKNPLLIDVVDDLKKQQFDSRDIANILRELHRTKAILGRLVEW
jgi:flagellar P-ring protein precursor FlgI